MGPVHLVGNHRIMEPLRLEKTSKIRRSNHHPTTTVPAKPRPEAAPTALPWAPREMGRLASERGDPQGAAGVLSWGLGRESAMNPPLLLAPVKEPGGAWRNTGANGACVRGEGFHAAAITGAAAVGNVSLAVETWQRNLPVGSPPCRAAALGCPQPGLRPAELGALVPSTAVPRLIGAAAPSDAQWGDLKNYLTVEKMGAC